MEKEGEDEYTAASASPKKLTNAAHMRAVIGAAKKRVLFQVEQDRMVIEAYDRMPPIPPSDLEKAGEAWRTNVDFGETEADINEKVDALNNLSTLPQPLISFKTRNYGVAPTTVDALAQVALEYDFLMTESDIWIPEMQKMCFNAVSTGLGILRHADPYSWHFQSEPRCNLVYPVEAGYNTSDWDWCAFHTNLSIVELIKKVKDAEAAKAIGWDVPRIKKLIANQKNWDCFGPVAPDPDKNPEAWIAGLVENDIYFASQNGGVVKAFSVYIRDEDGITERILVDSMDEGVGYVFEGKKVHSSMSDFMTLFPLCLGPGFLEKVRGFGHRVLPFNALINDVKNRGIDTTILAGSLMLKGAKEDGLNNVSDLTLGGVVTIIPQEYSLDQKSFGNPAQGLIAIEESLRASREANKRAFGGGNGEMNSQGTATYAKLKHASDTRGNAFESDRWYIQLTQFHRGVWKRLEYFAKGDESVPCKGRKEAIEFWEELKEYGVIAEDLKTIRSVQATSMFGDGDPAQVFSALQDLMPLMSSLPVSAQRQGLKMMIAARTRKPYLAESWLPTNRGVNDRDQSAQDWRCASEQDAFENGSPMPTQDDDISQIHVVRHTEWAEGVITNFEQGSLKPDEALKRLILVRDHTVIHMELLTAKKDEILVRDISTRWAQILNQMRRMEQMVKDAQQAESERQMEELRNPSMTVAERETMLTEQAKRAELVETERVRRSEISATEAEKRNIMTQMALTKTQMSVIDSVPILTDGTPQ